MDPSSILSGLAVIVAVVSALYARASAQAGRTANKINLHQPRKDIYDGLLDFRRLFRGMDAHPTDEDIDACYFRAVAPAKSISRPTSQREFTRSTIDLGSYIAY